MAMTINTNISSLNAQRNLTTSQSSLSASMQRLSSGMRINSAKDDAAGLAIAERMSAQITGLNQAGRNANDGVSLAQTAEGALGTIGTNLQRIRELAVQSRNATNSEEDRSALQKEVSQLKSEINRVAKDTAFNGTNLLDGSFTSKAFQVGANQGQTIEVNSIVDANIGNLGNWTSADVAAKASGATLTGGTVTAGAGTLDLTSITVDATNGVGAFSITAGGKSYAVTATAFATDDATTQAAVATKIAALTIPGLTGTATAASVTFANTNGNNMSVGTTLPAGPSAAVSGQTTTYAAITTPLEINGVNIQVGAATSDAQRLSELSSAINSAFSDGSVTSAVVDGKLQLTSKTEDLVIGGTVTGTGLTAGTTAFVDGTGQTGFENLDVSTVEGADDAILAMDAALKAVNSARADLGAIQNRFESVVSNLSVNSENLSASKSRIMDADFAKETANLSRSQVLQQAGTAMVAQANQLPQGVLSLLR
ncbi:MAG: flagellin [Comamonas sp.]